MSDQMYLYIALGLYFAGMLAIGYSAYRRTSGHEDYMIGGRSLPPWVAALSAGASDMSGWLIMGLPGAVYAAGLIEAWIAIGLTLGAYFNWLFVAPRLRAYTEVARNSITIPSYFENRLRDDTRLLRILSSLVILVFFTLYVSSGMVAGGVFFESSFGSNYLAGMVIVTSVTLAYTLFGGVSEAASLIRELEPSHFSFAGGTALTSATFIGIVSGLAWGLGYFGQPHIIVRFMALRKPAEAKSARRIGVTWQIVSLTGAVFSGLVGVAFIAREGIDLGNPETIVLVMSQTLLHPLVAGLVLAAVLAAIMSTFSSQLIVCSSALVEDLYKVFARRPPSERALVRLGRACVLAVAIIAAVLAINPNDTILGLVGFAWAGFGAAFGPIILLSLFWRRLTNWGAFAGIFVGSVTVFIWSAFDTTGLYELVPGFALGLAAAIGVSLWTYERGKHNEVIQQEFDDTGEMLVGVIRTKQLP